MAFTENNTLKELVDKTTLIKEDVTNNRDTLKANLANKGIDTVEVSKLPDLIDKVNEIEVEKHHTPDWLKLNDRYFDITFMPTRLANSAYTTVGDKIYCIGGADGSLIRSNNMYYDTTYNVWESKSNISTARQGASAVTYEDKIYLFGGRTTTTLSSTIALNECYDTLTDTWTAKQNMTNSRAEMSPSSNVSGLIYIIGGCSYTEVKALNECYNPILDTWTAKQSMTKVKMRSSSACIGNQIYIIGGEDSTVGGSQLNINECYDTLSDTWTTKQSIPFKWSSGFAVTYQDKIFICGGSGNDGNSGRHNYRYDTVADTWSKNTNMPENKFFPSAGIIDGVIYITGGYMSSSNLTNSTKDFVYLI